MHDNVTILAPLRHQVLRAIGERVLDVAGNPSIAESLQQAPQTPTIETIHDLPTVITFSNEIKQSVEWYTVVIVDQILQLPDGHFKVHLVEVVRDIPALRPEVSPLSDDAVEETQSIQELGEFLVFAGTSFEEVLAPDRLRPVCP